MRILITGGYGALGYYLLRGLRLALETSAREPAFGVFDIVSDFYFDEETDKVRYHERFDLLELNQAVRWASHIIHVAESGSPITPSSDAIDNNVGFTTQLLSIAAREGKRVIIPCWMEFDNNVVVTPWEASMKWRAHLATMFQQGNAVFTPLFLPRIISPLHSEYTFGNLVKRFYNSVITNHPASVFQGEITDEARWVFIGDTITAIADTLKTRSRAIKGVPGHKASTKSIAEYIAWKMGVEYIEVFEHKDNENRIAIYDSTTLESEHIRSAIDHCLKAWGE